MLLCKRKLLGLFEVGHELGTVSPKGIMLITIYWDIQHSELSIPKFFCWRLEVF